MIIKRGITNLKLYPVIIGLYFSNKIHRMIYMFHTAHSCITPENCKIGCKRSTEITISFTEIQTNKNNEQSKYSIIQGRVSYMLQLFIWHST